jgi:hypothetical protein
VRGEGGGGGDHCADWAGDVGLQAPVRALPSIGNIPIRDLV